MNRMPLPDRKLLGVISYHHACNDGTLMALVALLPILVDEMQLSYYEIGLLGFGLTITVVAQYVVGRYADRAFSSYLLEIGASLMAASFVMVLLVDDFLGLFVVVIAMRVGAAFYHPVGISWITREYSGEYLETALGIQSGVGNLGVIIALGSSGFLGEAFSWRAPCILWAGLNLLAVAMGVIVAKSSPGNTYHQAAKVPISPLDTLKKMKGLVLPIITGGALYQVTSYFGPIKLTTTSDWSAGTADLMFAVWIGVGTATSYYFGALCYRYGRVRLLQAGYLVSAGGVAVLALFVEWYAIGPALAAYGALLMLTYPALFSMTVQVTEENERATAFGILFGFQLGGGAATVYLCGAIADTLDDPSYSFAVVGAMALASLATVHGWERRRAGAAPPGTSS